MGLTRPPGDAFDPTVLAHYALGRLVAARRIPRGFVNQNWRIETTAGRFFLKRRHPALRRPALIRAQHALMGWLRGRGFPAPTVVPTRAGPSFLTLDDEIYEVHSFIMGTPFRHGHPAHLGAAARVLARYHTLIRGFDAPVLRTAGQLYHPSLAAKALTHLQATAQAEDESFSHLQAHIARLARRFAAHGPLSHLVIHGDYYADNLLFDGDRIVGVVDYDKANWQPRVAELAEALIYFTAPRPPQLKHLVYPGVLAWGPLSRFLGEYARVAPLSTAEACALPDFIACIWVQVALEKLAGSLPDRRDLAEALREVRVLADWSREHAARLSTMAG